MEYKIIEKTKYGIRVRNYSGIPDCNICKYHIEKRYCTISECAPNSYYLSDYEIEKLKNETNMKIAINGTIIDTKDIYQITSIEEQSMDHGLLNFRILFFNESSGFLIRTIHFYCSPSTNVF